MKVEIFQRESEDLKTNTVVSHLTWISTHTIFVFCIVSLDRSSAPFYETYLKSSSEEFTNEWSKVKQWLFDNKISYEAFGAYRSILFGIEKPADALRFKLTFC